MKPSFASGFRRRLPGPRRLLPQFTLGGVLALVTGFGVLLGLLRWLEASPAQWVLILSFFSAVCFGQRFLFGGRRPRIASILVGAPFAIALWYLAWKEAEWAAVGFGTEVPAGALVRDCLTAILLSGVLALAAHLLFTWALSAIELIGMLYGKLTGNQQRAHPAVEPLTGPRARCELEPRNLAVAEHAPLEQRNAVVYRPIVSAAVAMLVVGCAVVLSQPVQICFYHYVGEHCGRRALNWDRRAPSPLDIWLLWLSTDENTLDSSVYSQLSEIYRDRLVELGQLEHRVFAFKHIMTGPHGRRQSTVFRLALERFPQNIYTQGSWSDRPEPFRLYVWDRPDRIVEWEAFVREVDTPLCLDSVSRGVGLEETDEQHPGIAESGDTIPILAYWERYGTELEFRGHNA